MRALRTNAKAKDLASEIWTEVNPHLPEIRDVVQVADVLIAIFVRPNKTSGGIELPDSYRDEDIFQGKTGLIIKMGPEAFADDDTHNWPVKPKVGDWVAYRVSDGWPFYIGNQPCRLVNERGIRLLLNRPDVVY